MAAQFVEGHRVTSVLSVLFLFLPYASAFDDHQKLAVDKLIHERKAYVAKLEQPVRDATAKVDALEKKMLPLVFTFNRIGPVVLQRNAELDMLKIYLENKNNDFNPYDDARWMASARKETAYVCCDVRRNPKLAQEIQENLARGLPALSAATSGILADRVRDAGKKEVIADEPEEDSSRLNPRMRAPAPPPSAPPHNRKGLISGLPDLNPTPPPALVPPVPVVAPVVAPSATPHAEGAVTPPAPVSPSATPPSTAPPAP